jgi:hypothetical protein
MGIGFEDNSAAIRSTRSRSAKRWFGIILLSLLVLILIARFFWGIWADRQLQAQIDAVRARGEPIAFPDMNLPSVPNSRNAAWYYSQASVAIKHPQDIGDQWLGWDNPWTPRQLADLGKLVDDEAAALAFARRARPYSTAVWPDPGYANKPAIQVLLPDLNTARTLAQLLASAAFIDHIRGDDAEAIERIRDLHHEADAIEQYWPSTVTHLVAIGIDAITSDASLHISRDLRLSNGIAATRSSAASPKQVADLIIELADEQQLQSGGTRCWIGGRRVALDFIPMLSDAGTKTSWTLLLFRPALTADIARMLRNYDLAEKAISQSSWPAARATMSAIHQPQGSFAAFHMFSSILTPSLEMEIEIHFRIVAERRATTIALAICLYRADHGGHWPVLVAELVPRYLQAIPADPFSPTGAVFRYRLNPGGPIIYSVGQNGADDGGSEQLLPGKSKWELQNLRRWDRLDAVFHLTATAAATQPAS